MATTPTAARTMTHGACRIEAEELRGRWATPLSFSVEPGRITWVSGPSGSGKSSLVRVVLGVTAPAAGRLTRLVQQRRVQQSEAALCAWRARHVGVVPQGAGLVAALSADDHLALLGLPARERDAWLVPFGLHPRRHARADTLSGGEMRRLCAVRTLAVRAPLLIWDEPTAGLEEALAERMWIALDTAVAQGAAALVASHDDRGHALLSAQPRRLCDVQIPAQEPR